MLTTIIYRSHLCNNIPFKALEDMVEAANQKNSRSKVTGILLFNGTHFFQLLEGPEEEVLFIYNSICKDPRHYNLVELMHDYAPSRRFGNRGMELFDLRRFDKQEVLQNVLDQGTSRFQLTYHDRALQFFRTFVENWETDNYYEIPAEDTWEFVAEEELKQAITVAPDLPTGCTFAFQPAIDPFSKEIISYEALIRTTEGSSPDTYFASVAEEGVYKADLQSKSVALRMAKELQIGKQTLSVNLKPQTLSVDTDAPGYLLKEIIENGFVPEQVVIEFTEHEITSCFSHFKVALKHLKSTGFRVAIDHFGAGFAGLALLTQFQPDIVKINRDLIQNVHKSGPRQAVIQAIIKCCTSLEIQMIAVGIEKSEEWMWLESAGISQFQGNLFAEAEIGTIPSVRWPEMKSCTDFS